MADVRLSAADLTTLQADAIVVAVASASDRSSGSMARPELLGGAFSIDEAFGRRLVSILASLGADGSAGEVTKIPTLEVITSPLVVAVGVGPDVNTRSLRAAAGVALRSLGGCKTVALALPSDEAALVAAQVEGALLGGYDFNEYRSTSLGTRKPAVAELVVTVPEPDNAVTQAAMRKGWVLADAITFVRDLINTPPGDLSPAELARRAQCAGEDVGCRVDVLDEEMLRRAGYGGLMGVGAGSSRPPRLVQISYRPSGASTCLAIIGKGITFDSGGLALKDCLRMETMKGDMSGAAAVLGAVVAAARLGLPIAVTGWLACAENMPSSTATRPGDVLIMYGGKRVEVLNPDAEGRLVMADALHRACEDKPDVVLDIATLTGAWKFLGPRRGGLMTNDDALQSRVLGASQKAGEDFWPMPLPVDMRPRLDSLVADLTNVVGQGNTDSGMIIAGLFLQEFVAPGIPWAHLDIPFFNFDEPYAEVSRGGIGFGVRTLFETIESFASQS